MAMKETCHSPLTGMVEAVLAADGEFVGAGEPVLLVESMKMHHPIDATVDGTVSRLLVAPGTTVMEGAAVAHLTPGAVAAAAEEQHTAVDPAFIRPDLAEALARHEVGLDAARPEAVERRRAVERRTARENVADLLDPDSLVEYGPVVIAPQRRRRPVDELIRKTPADGMVGGVGTVNGRSVAVMSYDYTVLAGTQGGQNHRKKDRLFELAERLRLPVVFFTEGGGGRPGTGRQVLDGHHDRIVVPRFGRPACQEVGGYSQRCAR